MTRVFFLVAFAFFCAASARADTIIVTSTSGAHNVQDACVLRDAITQANTGMPTAGCGMTASPRPAPEMVDCLCTNNTIVLPTGATIELDEVDDAINNTGLPVVTNTLTIQGGGSVIRRDPNLGCNRDGKNDPVEFGLIRNTGSLLVLDHLTLSDGCADSSDYQNSLGGAISNVGTLVLQNVVLRDNYASGRGGAVYNGGGIGNVSDSTFAGNTAHVGGAIYMEGDHAALTISGSTFVLNSADPFQDGGAIVVALSTSATIVNSTFSKNSAASGSAIEADGVVDVSQSTFAENIVLGGGAAFAVSIADPSQRARIKNSLFNSTVSGSNCGFGLGQIVLAGVNLSSDASCTGFDHPNIDPLLLPLAANGGPTQTYALETISAAVDAVVDCTDFNGFPIATDQRGHPRPQNISGIGTPRCDIGSYELDDQIFSDGFELVPSGT